MIEHFKFYLIRIGHILIDSVFLVLWAGMIYLVHYKILPLFELSHFLYWMIFGIAFLIDACIGVLIIVKTIKDTCNEVRHIINGTEE